MSSQKEYFGWKLPSDVKLRKGQIDCLNWIQQNEDQQEYLFVLPTGYGKSFVTLLSYHVARLQGRCNRLLIVVVSEIQRRQYATQLAKDAKLLNVPLITTDYGHVSRECLGEGHVLRASLKNQCEIFLTTVQAIRADKSFYHDLMEKHTWMGVFDEAHRYSINNEWGKTLSELPFNVQVGLTATPLRSDSDGLVAKKANKYDVMVSTQLAIQEGAIRPFELKIADYEVDLSMEGHHTSMKLSEIMEDVKAGNFPSISEWEVKKQCRYSTKYIQDIFYAAAKDYHLLEQSYPQQNQMIVFAWSCEHAKSVCQAINTVMGANEDSLRPFADWIGTNGRSDKENKEVMESFMAKKDFLPCLVQVDKASEGFNNPRCSIAIFLNGIGADTPKLIQMLGRVMRKSSFTSPSAIVYVGVDHPLASANIDELGALNNGQYPEIDKQWEGMGMSESNQASIFIPDIQDIFMSIKRLINIETVCPFQGEPNDIANDLIQSGKYDPNDYDALLKNIMELQAKKTVTKTTPDISYSERIYHLRDENNKAVNMLVNGALRLKFVGMKPASSVTGDWFKKTNSHLKRMFKGKVSELDEHELMERHKYVQLVANDINQTKEVPSWMIP